MQITFWGATDTVTGSRFLVEAGGRRILVDCGLFQGLKRLRLRNWAPFPVPPESLDAVVLTHAHIDHSGYLPALVRDGFRGPVWCTPATADLCRILLLDAAHLQEEEARYANRHGTSRHRPALPLYTAEDALRALTLLRTSSYGAAFEPAPGVTGRFRRAGHILGAASVLLDDGDRTVLVSGDVGRPHDPVMRPPDPPPAVDHVVVESTYGNRWHPRNDPADELAAIVTRTVARRGVLLIPAFAVGRAQTVLHLLATLRAEGRIPHVPIWLNSPMAIDATELLFRHRDEHRLDDRQCAALREGVQLARSVEDSKRCTSLPGPAIVLSASGMATGGRVLHHLRAIAPHERHTILFVGYQAAGTRGEALLQGVPEVKVFGEYVPVRAEVRLLDGLSAHADAGELLDWLGAAPRPPGRVSLVHGEPAAVDSLRRLIRDRLGLAAHDPGHGETVTVEPAGP